MAHEGTGRGRRWLPLLLALLAAAVGFGATRLALGRRTNALATAQVALAEAEKLDAAIESAPDPAATAGAREVALQRAEQLFLGVLRSRPDLPEAEIGLGQVTCQHVGRAIELLAALSPRARAKPRADGRTGTQLLAAAHAERAGYLLARLGPGLDLADPQVKLALGQAAADAGQAAALDPQPRYQALLDTAARLGQGQDQQLAPADPAALTPRQP
jgi:hypothetical protein